jgi:hypothetical protein
MRAGLLKASVVRQHQATASKSATDVSDLGWRVSTGLLDLPLAERLAKYFAAAVRASAAKAGRARRRLSSPASRR